MSVHEISVLRKSKDFDSAFKMAKEELEADPNNEWIQMAMFWVLKDICLELYIPNNQTEKVLNTLAAMEKLLPTMRDEDGYGQKAFDNLKRQLTHEASKIDNATTVSKSNAIEGYEIAKEYILSSENIDTSYHNQLGWILYRYIKAMLGTLNSVEVRRLLSHYIKLKNERPSILHSQILRLALKFSQNNLDFNFYKFLLLWNPKQLNSEDFETTEYNGHEIKPFVNHIFNQLINGRYDISVETLSEHFNLETNEIVEHLREASFWFLWSLWNENKKKDYFDEIIKYCEQYAKYGPSHWHSEILNKALRSFVEQDEEKFIYFFQKWDYNNLREEDWKTSQDQKGNTYPSTAESAAKKCFNSVKNMSARSGNILTWLSNFFDAVEHRLEDNEWMVRNRAIIYLWENKKEEAITYYKNVLLKLSDKFYIWSELANCIEERDLKIALLSKALLLERNESFLGDIHLNIASQLIQKGLYPNAMYELNCYKAKREAENWKVSRHYIDLFQEIPSGTQAARNNLALYNEYAPFADAFAFSNIPAETFIFLDHWEKNGKKRCTLITTDGTSIQVNERRFSQLRTADPGTLFDVKYIQKEEEGKNKLVPLIIKKSEKQDLSTTLPVQYGYVSYINHEKKSAYINSQTDALLFYPLNTANCKLSKEDFVSFHVCTSNTNKGSRDHILGLNICEADTALAHFKKRIVVVDNINEERNIIHYQAGPKLIDGVIFFNQTSIRPRIGDCLEITYYTLKDKTGNKKRNVLKVVPTTCTDDALRKTIAGHLSLKYKDNKEEPEFAFINDHYVHKSILRKYHINTDCEVKAVVIYAGSDKWKTISIEKI